jgi:hypothetical protein
MKVRLLKVALDGALLLSVVAISAKAGYDVGRRDGRWEGAMIARRSWFLALAGR